MLVLSRKLMESIDIGGNVVVTVLTIRGGKVQIGIDAPKEVRVLRTELQPEVAGAPGKSPQATFPPKKSYDFRGT
jgi:carbon storage regulator CsrA